MAGYWVRFTENGTPDWFGPEPIDRAEWIEGVDRETLIGKRRVRGKWVGREPEKPVEPDPAQVEAEYLAAVEAREADVDQAIRTSSAYRQFIRGEMTLTAYRDAASEIAKSFPMPVKP